MGNKEVMKWLSQEDQCRIILAVRQPMTATQLSHKTHVPRDKCSTILLKLKSLRLVRCLNPQTQRSRLYWPTRFGKQCQRKLDKSITYDYPKIDWPLYGNMCFGHRAPVIRVLTRAMQPSQIQRLAFSQDSNLRMSPNNVRDVIGFLKRVGIVRKVKMSSNDVLDVIRFLKRAGIAIRRRDKTHFYYELIEHGKHFQRLLMQAEVYDAKH